MLREESIFIMTHQLSININIIRHKMHTLNQEKKELVDELNQKLRLATNARTKRAVLPFV